jgi:hypothetical protein
MSDEMKKLDRRQRAAVARMIAKARKEPGHHSETLPDGSEAYAYSGLPRVHWGLNSGETGANVARGVSEE